MKRILLQMLALVAAACAAGAISNGVRSTLSWRGNDPLLLQKNVERIDVEAAAALQDDPRCLFLDVRPPADYERARIRGALPFSAGAFDAAYAEVSDFLAADVQVVVYGTETLPAVRAAEFLTARGHRVRVLDGGWGAWQERGLPQDAEAAP